jgi:DNA-directed RNA polymerase specialized sigma24 family protein
MKPNRLPEEKARRVLELRGQKISYQEIAQTVECSISTVANICKGRTWARLDRAV